MKAAVAFASTAVLRYILKASIVAKCDSVEFVVASENLCVLLAHETKSASVMLVGGMTLPESKVTSYLRIAGRSVQLRRTYSPSKSVQSAMPVVTPRPSGNGFADSVTMTNSAMVKIGLSKTRETPICVRDPELLVTVWNSPQVLFALRSICGVMDHFCEVQSVLMTPGASTLPLQVEPSLQPVKLVSIGTSSVYSAMTLEASSVVDMPLPASKPENP